MAARAARAGRGGGRRRRRSPRPRRRSPRPRQDPELQTGACWEEAEGRLTGSGLGRRRRRSAAAVEPGPPLSHPSGLRGRAEPRRAAGCRAGASSPLLCPAACRRARRCCWCRLGSAAQPLVAPHRRGSKRQYWRPPERE